MKNEAAAGVVVERLKERDPLDVVPVEVGNKDMRLGFFVAKLCAQALAQRAQAGTTVENQKGIADAHLDAGGVATITHVFCLGGRSRAADSPEFDVHAPPDRSGVLSIFRRRLSSVNDLSVTRRELLPAGNRVTFGVH